MTVLITGGCGFIGTNFIRRFLSINDEKVVNYDLLTYSGNRKNLAEYEGDPNYMFVKGCITNRPQLEYLIETENPRAIINFAAESHVDNSIKNSAPFIGTNVYGTASILDAIKNKNPEILLVHISTDEVFGSLGKNDPDFTETTPYDPSSPYSASKAASDHFVRAYARTFKLKTIITNCSNNYGPFQHSEKFIPTIIRNALRNEKIPIYGNGSNIRDWLYVEDHCDAIMQILERGRIGHSYNIGGGNQIDNLALTKMILKYMDKPESLIEFVEDRKGHDYRYGINFDKVYLDIGWYPTVDLDTGLQKTIEWYLK
jgi:dTDP-glucose 4,6-dehydratase